MNEVIIKGGTVFDRIEASIKRGNKVIINKGGTGSGKSEDTIRWLFLEAMNQSLFGHRVKNEVITVTSESYPHLSVGIIRMLEGICAPAGLWTSQYWNKSKSIWQSPVNGNIIEFLSADRIGKALGARRYILYGNEINNLKQNVWDEMARRSQIITADFNPTAQFWLEDWMQNYDNVGVITSNYSDNPFLSDTEASRIEKRSKRDANFRRIHIDVEYGVYEGLVFEHFNLIDQMPEGKARYGMDFGFTADPTTLIKVIETPEAYYLDELIYQTGMLNRNIITRMETLGIIKHRDEIIADSADPKSIKEIQLAGFNIKGAQKGADSIRAGVDRLQSKSIFITKRSINLIKEFRNYRWDTDKTGKRLNKPIDDFNHGIDAVRYATEPPKHSFNYAIA